MPPTIPVPRPSLGESLNAYLDRLLSHTPPTFDDAAKVLPETIPLYAEIGEGPPDYHKVDNLSISSSTGFGPGSAFASHAFASLCRALDELNEAVELASLPPPSSDARPRGIQLVSSLINRLTPSTLYLARFIDSFRDSITATTNKG